MSFTYNDEGIRTSKTVNGVTHTYILNGCQILAEEWEDKLLVYLYDASGSPIGMMYRNTSYAPDQWNAFYFEKNLQGDIVAVYNRMGLELVTYSYDAWGNQAVKYWNGGGSTAAQYNPFRYRGYYYDTDLRMYYLQSRYYDSKICRFISPDTTSVLTATPGEITDKNLFAYCDNNPVMRVDESGEFWSILIGAGVGLVVQYISDILNNIQSGETGKDIFKPTSSGTDYLASIIGGAVAAIPIPGVFGAIATGFVANICSDTIRGKINSAEDFLMSGVKGAGANLIGYGVGHAFAAIKVDAINAMPRSLRKSYLTDVVFGNSHDYVNANLNTFRDNPWGIVNSSFNVFRYGVYSTISSTIFGAVFYK